jgi:hypothetical protein
MAVNYEFIDGFDGWSGMGAYTASGADASHSPWMLRDRTADLAFDPGATDYSDMVSTTEGVFGGGALRLPARDLCELMPRFATAHYLSWYPIDNYTIGGNTIIPTVPHVVTWGYYLKTAANGFNGLRPACSVELYRWSMVGYQESAGTLSGTKTYAHWPLIKRPDNKLWGGWLREDTGQVDSVAQGVLGESMSGFGSKFYFLSSAGIVAEGDWPSINKNGTTFDISDTLSPPLGTAHTAMDTCHNFVDKHYVLGKAVGGVTRVFEFDLNWVATGNEFDVNTNSNEANGICYIQEDDEFIIGANSTDGRTLARYDSSFNFVSSSVAGLVAGSTIQTMCAAPKSTDQFWYVYINGTTGDYTIVEPALAYGAISSAPPAEAHTGIYDDGFFCWTVGGDTPGGGETNRGFRHFYRGLPLSNVGLVDGGSPDTVLFDWGKNYYMEHSYRALSSLADVGGDDGVGVATTRVDGVKLPTGQADPTVTARGLSGIQPYLAQGNFHRMYLQFFETHHRLSGDIAFMDDFYLKTDTTKPTADPDNYEGEIKIHTLRPTRVSGTLAPVGDFSIFGWPETVNRAQASNDNTAYVVAQDAGDSSRLYFDNVPTFDGTIGCVVPVMSYNREELDLTTSTYPDTEHDVYAQIGITSSNTEGGLVDIPQPDPGDTGISKFTAADPYNVHISAACDMYGQMTGYMISETDPLTGAPWSQTLVDAMKMHIKAADNDPFKPWPWTQRDEV